MKRPVYQPTGDPGGVYSFTLPLGALAAIVVGAGIGWAEARLWGRLIHTFLLSFVWLCAGGMLLGALCRRVRCRRASAAAWVAVLVGCVAVYARWVAFEVCLPAPGPMEGTNVLARFGHLFFHPESVWNNARAIADHSGTIAREAFPDSDSHERLILGAEALWSIWALDAVWTVAVLVYLTRSAIGSGVYCEECGRWAGVWRRALLRPPAQMDLLQPTTEEGKLAPLWTLEHAPSRLTLPRLMLEVYRCRGCGKLYAWRLKLFTRGHKSVNIENLTPFYVPTAEDVAEVRANCDLVNRSLD